MKKASLMNGITVVAYSAIAMYLVVALVTFFVWVTGGFRKYTEEAGGLKFDCMAVSIADNGGTATLKVLSNYATSKLNTKTGEVTYTDPSVPIEITLEVRDKDGKLMSGIVEVPNTVKLGEEFEIKAIIDEEDGFNIGGDCYLYAYSTDDMLSSNPLPVFVDVPIKSATLLYYDVDVDLNTAYKRTVETVSTDAEGNETILRTTIFYKNISDYQSDTNGIVPLNREIKSESSAPSDGDSEVVSQMNTSSSVTQGLKNQNYQTKELSCVKGDRFQLYVDVYPTRALNPHTYQQVASDVMLKNLDSQALFNACAELVGAYAEVGTDEEKLQNYVEMFAKAWKNIGLNTYVNLDGFITQTKINQAVEKVGQITADSIERFYQNVLGQTITFGNKDISFETPVHYIAEVDNDTNTLIINSTPTSTNANNSLVSFSVQTVYNGTIGGANIYNNFVDEENTIQSIESESKFVINDVYFDGLGFDENTSKDSVVQKLKAPLNVANNRLLVSAQPLSDQQKSALLASTANDYTKDELNNAINLGIVIKTKDNNQASNPSPLKSEFKNLELFCNQDGVLYIQKDTTLGEENVVWLIIPQKDSLSTVSLSVSLTQELNKLKYGDEKYLSNNGSDDSGIVENGTNLAGEEQGAEAGNNDFETKIEEMGEGDNKYYKKTAYINNLTFKIEILTPNLNYESTVNLSIKKYDFDDTKSTEYSVVDMQSLLLQEFDPLEYSYGKIVYVVTYSDAEGNVVTAKNDIINVTTSTDAEGNISNYLGQLYIDLQSLNGVAIDSSTRFRLIQPTGAGTVYVTPLLVKTQRINGVDYPIKLDGTQLSDNEILGASFSVADNVFTSDTFDIVKTFNTITINVKEEITEFAYFKTINSNGNFEDKYTSAQDVYWATGSDNQMDLYVSSNSKLALPSDKSAISSEYTYNYKVMSGNDDVTGEVIISYPENKDGATQQFATSSAGINYMKLSVYVNPLKSESNKIYTIKWYQGTVTNKYLYEIPHSDININAKDYVGTSNSLNFGADESNAYYNSITSIYKANLNSEYNLKLQSGGQTKSTGTEVLAPSSISYGSDLDYVTLGNVEYLTIKNPKQPNTTWGYVQNTVYLSVKQCTTKYYWLVYKEDGTFGTEEMSLSDLSYYFVTSTLTSLSTTPPENASGEETGENSGEQEQNTPNEASAQTDASTTYNVLYLKNLLPSRYVGAKVEYTYAPGFEVDTPSSVSEYVLLGCPSESGLTSTNCNWDYKDSSDNKLVFDKPIVKLQMVEFVLDPETSLLTLKKTPVKVDCVFVLASGQSGLTLTNENNIDIIQVDKTQLKDFDDATSILLECSITIKFTLPQDISGSSSVTLKCTSTLTKGTVDSSSGTESGEGLD